MLPNFFPLRFCTLDLDLHWTLDFGHWTLDSFWTLDSLAYLHRHAP
jgi:hypothetical protein